MEKHEFMPRSAPSADLGLRDLPPEDHGSLAGAPRMERPSGQGNDCGNSGNSSNNCGCGCSCNSECIPSSPCPGDVGGCEGHEGCGPNSWGLTDHPVAMVYAPCQDYRALYDPATALERGTLFTELDLPLGGDCAGFSTIGCACRAGRSGL